MNQKLNEDLKNASLLIDELIGYSQQDDSRNPELKVNGRKFADGFYTFHLKELQKLVAEIKQEIDNQALAKDPPAPKTETQHEA